MAWSSPELTVSTVGVAALEREHEWTIVSATDTTLTMTYKRTLQLHFTPHSFRRKGGDGGVPHLSVNSPISLTYIADVHEHRAQPLTTEKRFFLQIMRAQLQFIEQSKVPIKRVLDFVSTSWEKACHIAHESRVLGVQYLTTPMISSDETMAIKSRILLRAIKTKVEVQFEVITSCGDGVAEVEVMVKPSAKVVYGKELNVKKMNDLLKQRIGHGKKSKARDGVCWANAINELEEHLAARGKKS